MHSFTLSTAFQRAAALFLAAMMVPAGWAQDAAPMPSAPSSQMPAQHALPSSQPFDVQEYAKPQSHFPDPIGPYGVLHRARGKTPAFFGTFQIQALLNRHRSELNEGNRPGHREADEDDF